MLIQKFLLFPKVPGLRKVTHLLQKVPYQTKKLLPKWIITLSRYKMACCILTFLIQNCCKFKSFFKSILFTLNLRQHHQQINSITAKIIFVFSFYFNNGFEDYIFFADSEGLRWKGSSGGQLIQSCLSRPTYSW